MRRPLTDTTPAVPEPARPARTVQSVDPVSGTVWREYAVSGPAEVRAAVERARAAQPAWGALPVTERAAVLERFRAGLVRRRHDVVETLTRETGKPAAEALGSEILIVLDFAVYFAREAARLQRAPWRQAASVAMFRKRVRIEHVPVGVVGVISPWNYPFMLAAGVVLPALATGNAVLCKPSELTPATGVLLGELLLEAEIPDGIVTVLPGDGATGAALTSAALDKVFFTGSVRTGRQVAMACAEHGIAYSLELGGNDAAIVLADANVATAARGIAWGRFTNAGQTCVAPKRVFVVDEVFDEFMAAMRAEVESPGAGEHGGTANQPLIRRAQVEVLEAQLGDALALGARVVARASGRTPAGAAFAPTVIVGATPAMRVMREETFGPLLTVVRVRDADDAVARANASEFGLSASIWTTDLANGVRLADRIDAGTVCINDVAVVAGMADVPHGGVKASGTGRSHGVAGLLECVRTKTTVAERWSGWRQPWWSGNSAAQARGLDAFLQLAHGSSLTARARGIAGTLRMLFPGHRSG